ncbi:MAG: hypothetical protein ABI728_10230 [Betaproteobacteria bacterium]
MTFDDSPAIRQADPRSFEIPGAVQALVSYWLFSPIHVAPPGFAAVF